MAEKYGGEGIGEIRLRYFLDSLKKAFGSINAVKDKRILDLGCGSSVDPERGSREYEPWFPRLLVELGAKPVGIDIGKFQNEEFENYSIDLSVKGALDFLPDKSFDGVHEMLMVVSARKGMSPRQLNKTEMKNELEEQSKRLLKDDGKIIYLNFTITDKIHS